MSKNICRPLLSFAFVFGAFLLPNLHPAVVAQARFVMGPDNLPAWTSKTGARSAPRSTRIFLVNVYGAVGDGVKNSTRSIQQAIDVCAREGGGIVSFKPGKYVTGALFLKSEVELRVDSGVELLGSQDDSDYPWIWTRVAGIEMNWPAALVNVNDQHNVRISGNGTINGRGDKWWERYLEVRLDHDARGLRWAADYDAARVRLMVISRSQDVTVENLSLQRSGFWTVQVVYSDHVTVDGLKISDNAGPSTDGVDIDSSSYVLVQNCDIDDDDDDICLKAGRDADGLRVNRPTEYVLIRNNTARHGSSIVAFGSETSGGIRNVVVYRNRGVGTSDGIRFKSARTRGGFVADVLIRDLTMENVTNPFTFTLNWNPSYSYASIPKGAKDVPAAWTVLATPVTPPERGLCDLHNITFENVAIVGARRIFSVEGLREKPIGDVKWLNISAMGRLAGSIKYARDWTMKNVRLKLSAADVLTVSNSENVETPEINGP
ncbi:MAG TPA: glycosyl hydrolase family 28 protein [Pyrinomonadaceae bacterium]|nr:glycosyl hydrolase family 28 protein [Pyrinomonadaceae bacterium]